MAIEQGHHAPHMPPVRHESIRNPPFGTSGNDFGEPGMQERLTPRETHGDVTKEVPGVVERPLDE